MKSSVKPEVSFSREDAARSSLIAFAAYVDEMWAPHPHVRLIARYLEAVERGDIANLMIFVPNQYGKSLLSARYFAAWYLGRNPTKRIILASYSAALAESHSRVARDVLKVWGQRLFRVLIREDMAAANEWGIWYHRGGLHAAGVGGPIPGFAAECVLMDDPVPSREAAESEAQQKKAIEWYYSAIVPRRPKQKIFVMTPWSEGDLAAQILKREGADWTVLRLPALAEDNDPLGRASGEALCPVFQTREELLKIKAQTFSQIWSSQYECRPRPLEGGLFKRARTRRYRVEGNELILPDEHGFLSIVEEPDKWPRFITCDTATSLKEEADQTAIATWGVWRDYLVLLALDMRRMEGPEIFAALVDASNRGRCIPWIEDNATSKHLLQFLDSQGIMFRTVEPGATSKYARAFLHAAGLWERGKILIPEEAPWLEAYERQMFSFGPSSDGEDDAVDATSYAAKIFVEEGIGASGPPVPAPKPREYLPPGWAMRGSPWSR